MYFDKHAITPIFCDYRRTTEIRNRLLDRYAHLNSTAKERLRRRLKDTGNAHDTNLERVTIELAEVNKRYAQLRERIAEVAYLVAGNYWPKFYERDSLSSHSEGDDAIQAAVFKIVQVAHRYDPDRAPLFNFLSKICKNEFISTVRKAQQNTINHIRHVESFHGRELEVEILPEPEVDDAVEVISPEWRSQRPISSYASYGDGDETTEIRFSLRKKKKRRKCDEPSLSKYVAALSLKAG